MWFTFTRFIGLTQRLNQSNVIFHSGLIYDKTSLGEIYISVFSNFHFATFYSLMCVLYVISLLSTSPIKSSSISSKAPLPIEFPFSLSNQ